MSEKYYSLTQLKSIMRTEGNQWTGPYQIIHPYDLKKLKPADVRPVVLCKDCVRWRHSQLGKTYCSIWGWIPYDDHFCGIGKRRDGGADG